MIIFIFDTFHNKCELMNLQNILRRIVGNVLNNISSSNIPPLLLPVRFHQTFQLAVSNVGLILLNLC